VLRGRPYILGLEEVANALWKRVVLLRDVGRGKAVVLLNDLLGMGRGVLRIEPQEWYIHHAFEIAVRKGITIYDALFIAQALSKGAALVTSDEEQYRKALELGLPAGLEARV